MTRPPSDRYPGTSGDSRETDCYYVDKTPLIRDLVERSDHCFLSRPRRFGKSLLLDTLRSLFECREGLFRGLDIHGHWDWSAPHPVVRLSFDGKYGGPGEIEGGRHRAAGGDRASVRPPSRPGVRHRSQAASERSGPPAPRLRAAGGGPGGRVRQADPRRAARPGAGDGQPRLPARALRHRQGQRRARPLHLRHRRQHVLEGQPVLGPQQPEGHQPRPALRHDLRLHRRRPRPGVSLQSSAGWTGTGSGPGTTATTGSAGRGSTNPYDVLLLLDGREFRPWWFETGSPAFLFRTLVERSVGPMELENRMADMPLVSKFDVDDIGVEGAFCSRPAT